MSSPACADGYDMPAQQREDSTTFMLSMAGLSVTYKCARLYYLIDLNASGWFIFARLTKARPAQDVTLDAVCCSGPPSRYIGKLAP